MRHHKLYRSLRIALLIVLLLNLGLLILWLTGKLDPQQTPPSRLPVLALPILGTAVWYTRRRYLKIQARLNQAGAAQGVLLLLAPHPAEPLATHDLVRRFPGQYIQRSGDWPCAHISLELSGDPFQMVYGCYLPGEQLRPAAIKEIVHEWHGTQIEVVTREAGAGGGATDPIAHAAAQGADSISWCTLKLQKDDVYPLHIPEQPVKWGLRSRDAAETFLAALQAAPPGICAGVQLLIRPSPTAVSERWASRLRQWEEKLNQRGSRSRRSGDGLATTTQAYGPAQEHQLRREIDMMVPRQREGQVELCLRLWAAGHDGPLVVKTVEHIAQNIITETRSPFNTLVMAERGQNWLPVLERHFPPAGGFVLTAGELGRLFHIPDRETMALYPKLRVSAADVRGPGAALIVPPAQVPSLLLPGIKEGLPARIYGTFALPTGETLYIGQPLAATTTHSLTTGSNGTGKSVAAANMALQDWLAGQAVLVIDPHGALLDHILTAVPPEREADVTILDMESSQPFQFNICQVGRGEGAETAVAYLMEAIRIGEPAAWDSAVGMKEVLENALMVALQADEKASLVDVAAVLEPAARMAMLDKVTARTPEAQEAVHFWKVSFPRWNKNDQKRALTAAQRRINKFLKSPLIRRTLAGSLTTFDLAAALQNHQLILAPMPPSLGAENKRIWSALLVRHFITVLTTLPHTGSQTTLIVDELKDTIGTLAEFVTTIVEQLRKYQASGNFFTQAFDHLPAAVVQALKNECRTQICFNCGPDNAAIAASIMGDGLSARDIQKVPPYHAFVKLAIPGAQTAPCLIRMLPPLSRAPAAASPTTGRARPGPPAEFLKPPPPGKEPAAQTAAELLYWIERDGETQREEILACLLTLPPETRHAVWQKKKSLEQWKREQLLHQPWLVPDNVQRIKALSSATIGIPWWVSDTAYAQKRMRWSPPHRQESEKIQRPYR